MDLNLSNFFDALATGSGAATSGSAVIDGGADLFGTFVGFIGSLFDGLGS